MKIWSFFVFYCIYLDFARSSIILALNSGPLKSCATILPDASSIKVAGIDSTLYCLAIGSSQNFKLETCVQLNLSFAMASFQAPASLSNETPMMFKPFECNSL